MSRTDKHAPYWTWATWYEPNHHLYCQFYRYRARGNTRYEPCNLPESPVRHTGARTRVHVPLCTWEPVWPVRYREVKRLFGKAGAPEWFIRHVWSGPERVRERDKLGKMVKEYNATGGLDDGDFPNWQARHCARWLWD
jgi:hypothetical protein